MSAKLIFITGATGFIGATTALHALKAGYRLRISVRKETQIEKLQGIFSEFTEKIEYVVVPDITIPGAFDKVLDGVDFIIHAASPLAGSIKKEEMLPPALNGTMSILRSAKNVSTIKKVVITSSVIALEPLDGVPEGGVTREENGWDLSVDPEQNFDTGNDMYTSFRLYGASKLLANNASWEFVEQEKPGFTLFSIHPTMVYGHNLIQQSAKEAEGSTNSWIFDSVMKGPLIGDAILASVYVGDVADVHLKCLEDSVTKGNSYLLCGPKYTWKDIVDVMERDHPGVQHKLDLEKEVVQKPFDASIVEKELGIKWTAPEKMIKEFLDQQLSYVK